MQLIICKIPNPRKEEEFPLRLPRLFCFVSLHVVAPGLQYTFRVRKTNVTRW